MKFKFKNKKNNGFTLIELMVGIALFAIISMVLVSVMSFSLRMNYINKDTYDSDSYSKAFFEALKTENARPVKPTPPAGGGPASFSKVYKKTFSDVSQVTNFALNEYKDPTTAGITDPTTAVGDKDQNISNAINAISANPDIPTDTMGMMVKLHWNNTQEIYEIETWTWTLDKPDASLVNRKTLQSPTVPATP